MIKNIIKFKKAIFLRIAFSLITSILICLVLNLEVFIPTANRISDEVYQTHTSPNPEIVIIGMDEKSLAAYGQMPWSRDIMAAAINQLNADENKRPAVIGIDTLYTIESESSEDAQLVAAVQSAGNVVTATSITFGSELVTLEDGSFYMSDFAVLQVEEPFDALAQVSTSGHLNAMLDSDGILRHVLGEVVLTDGREFPSFNETIYHEYMKSLGTDATSPPHTDTRGRWYLPFTSYPGSYDDGYSLVDLVEEKLDPDLFTGKIVLIGPYALGLNDEYLTAIDQSSKMFGVEYQANAIAALINGNLKTEILEFPQQILLFIITFLVLLYFYEKKLLRLTIVWITLCALWFAFCILAWNLGYVFYIFYIVTAITIAYIISVAFNYFKSSMEKNKITTAFQRYVAPQLVSKILESEALDLKLGGKLTEIAVVFADIRGFTPLSEILPPDTVAAILNRYLSMMSECIFKYGGTLDKYVGDCAMAFWGAPLEDEESALKAVKCSLEIIEKGAILEKELFENYSYKVGIGVGINYGSAVVGNFGSQNRMDYTAIGDTVNIAARLESNAKRGCILVSGAVYDKLKDEVAFSKVEEDIILKGKTQKVEIYSVENLLL